VRADEADHQHPADRREHAIPIEAEAHGPAVHEVDAEQHAERDQRTERGERQRTDVQEADLGLAEPVVAHQQHDEQHREQRQPERGAEPLCRAGLGCRRRRRARASASPVSCAVDRLLRARVYAGTTSIAPGRPPGAA
jgi:hypothetical protein